MGKKHASKVAIVFLFSLQEAKTQKYNNLEWRTLLKETRNLRL